VSQSDPALPPAPPQPARPHWTFISVALFVIGLLILIPSGLCTAVLGVMSLGGGDPSFLGIVLLVGVLPMAIGLGLVYAGLNTRRRD
jgi:hypothetical protein